MKQFEVVFLNEDKKEILEKKVVNEGESVAYTGRDPEKDPINGIKYVFVGWENEEKMSCVEENLELVAIFEEENSKNMEEALYDATVEVAENADLNSTIKAGNKLTEQKRALEQDPRSASEIVDEIVKNGKTEVGPEINKDDVER